MKKIRIGVIGFGRMGRGMVSVMRMDDRHENNATGTQRILEINQLICVAVFASQALQKKPFVIGGDQ